MRNGPQHSCRGNRNRITKRTHSLSVNVNVEYLMFRLRPLAETRRAPDNLTTTALDGTQLRRPFSTSRHVALRRVASRCVASRHRKIAPVIGCRSVDLDAILARYVEATVSGRERVSH